MDELKRYAPTARRLARLREAGVLPEATAVSGAITLLGATGALLLLGGPLLYLAREILARDLQQASVAVADEMALVKLLSGHLALAGLLVVFGGGGLLLLGLLARVVQTGAVGRPGGGLWQTEVWGGGGRSRPWPGLLLGGLALAAGAVVFAGLLGNWTRAQNWGELLNWAALAQTWGRWLAVLAATALLHLLWTRSEYLRQARLSHRELVDEQKETRGPDLVRQRQRGRSRY